MRRRIMVLAAATALLAVTLLAIPLAVLIERNYLHDERLEVQQAAATAAAHARGETPSHVPAHVEGREIAVTVYDRAGLRLSGTGPPTAPAQVRSALAGTETSSTGANSITVTAPVSDGDHVVAALLVTTGLDAVHHRTRLAWLVLGGMCLGAVALAAAGAAVVTRRLIAPIDRLRSVARRMGAGELTARAPASGVAELDALADALNDSVAEIATMLDRERAFSAEVSHQLRTPLNGLQLQLDAARAALAEATQHHAAVRRASRRLDDAMQSVTRLERTVVDVISLARDLPVGRTAQVATLVDALDARWHGLLAADGRPLRITVDHDAPSTIRLSPAAAGQILDVLLDNARRHGRGAVTVLVAARDGDMVSIEVGDEGRVLGEAWQLFGREEHDAGDRARSGIGLPYARRLAEAEGARLVLARDAPASFALVVAAGPTGSTGIDGTRDHTTVGALGDVPEDAHTW